LQVDTCKFVKTVTRRHTLNQVPIQNFSAKDQGKECLTNMLYFELKYYIILVIFALLWSCMGASAFQSWSILTINWKCRRDRENSW